MDQSAVAIIGVLAALGGSLIGATTSIVTLLVQTHRDDKKHRQQLAVQLAADDRKLHLENAKPGTAVPPISVYLVFYVALLDEVAKGTATAERIGELYAENQILIKAAMKR